MLTVRHIGLLTRTTFGRFIYLVPAFVISAMILGTLSCRTTNSGSKNSPTATPTVGTGALAFVTNFNDGKVSSFTRNTNTGVLKRTGQIKAGNKGPRGVIASPSGSFLYVANINDNNIYQFAVSSTNGTLTPLSPPSVSNGNATEPDELAMNSGGTLLWVTGRKGTVTSYTVNTSTGQITKASSLGGFNTPFGVAVNPNANLPVLYMSDTTTGLIWPMTYNTNTGKLSANLPAVHSSDMNANSPGAIAIDAGGDALFIADQTLGEISSFLVSTSTGELTQGPTFQNSSVGDTPIGVGIAVNAGIEFLFTANQGGNSVSSFQASGTTVVTPPTLAGPYNGPTGLVVDPQMANVYTANNRDGTVAQSVINGTSCGSQICTGPTVSTESPANPKSGPFGITLAP